MQWKASKQVLTATERKVALLETLFSVTALALIPEPPSTVPVRTFTFLSYQNTTVDNVSLLVAGAAAFALVATKGTTSSYFYACTQTVADSRCY